MQRKGLLMRGSVATEIRGNISDDVATWHIPEAYNRPA